jgi:hypothetical protein
LMPADYSQRLTARELDDIISFLMNAAATNSKATAHSQKDSAGRRQ